MQVVFLALSTFRLDKEDNCRVLESTLKDQDQELGKYYHQMEPILLLYKKRGIVPDAVLVLCTGETRKKKHFICGEKKYYTSEEEYYREFIINSFGRDLMRPVYESYRTIEENGHKKTVHDDVKTISSVISELRKYRETDNDLSLSIDIHGGPRETQMLIQSIISLLRFENIVSQENFTVRYNTETHIGKIEPAYDIHQFVTGMSEFLSYGRSATLVDYYRGSDNELANLIEHISDAIQLCHINKFDDAIKDMKKYVDNYKEKGDFSDLFIDEIKASYGELMDVRDRNKVIYKVKWCVDHDFIQQALTIIESQMPYELLRRNIINYKYDNENEKSVCLYCENERGLKAIGNIKLSDALDSAKPEWESEINYSLIAWIRKNLCTLKKYPDGHKVYNPKLVISGNCKETYLSHDTSTDDLSKNCNIYFVKRDECGKKVRSAIKLSFLPNDKLAGEIQNDLKRLLMLHLALKEQRNVSNHASSASRASSDEVRVAIDAYIELTEKIFDTLNI